MCCLNLGEFEFPYDMPVEDTRIQIGLILPSLGFAIVYAKRDENPASLGYLITQARIFSNHLH